MALDPFWFSKRPGAKDGLGLNLPGSKAEINILEDDIQGIRYEMMILCIASTAFPWVIAWL